MTMIENLGKQCCGCHGCEQICPVSAISFSIDIEGFSYPVVGSSCIECGKCEKVCPVLRTPEKHQPQIGYAAYVNDRNTLRRSSSGGMFVAAAEWMLQTGGVVVGCAEAEPGYPKHVIIDNIADIPKLQGSKYVQSDMSEVYTQVRDFLRLGRKVLFTGTPCQVAGLRKFAGDQDRLYTIDIICHGVPSRKLYRAYLAWLEKKTGAKVEEFRFRSKDKHGWSLTYQLHLRKGAQKIKQERIATLSPYYSHFLRGMTYRESCYVCPFACPQRVGDITIGDFWGIEQVMPRFLNMDGVSAVLVNTLHGSDLWSGMQDRVVSQEVPAEQIIAHNGQLNRPTGRPPERDNVYALLVRDGYDAVAKAYTDRKLAIIDGIKDFVPNHIRQKIKGIIRNWMRS